MSRESDREDDERQRQQTRQQQSLWDLINPLNWFSSFGGLLFLGLIGAGLYYCFGTERGRAMMGEAFSNLSPEWQARLAGWGGNLGLFDGVGTVAANDREGTQRALQIVRTHGGDVGHVITGDLSGVMTPDILYAQMTENPQWMIAVARAMPHGGNSNSPMAQQAMTAVRGIVGNPQRLNTLLSDTNRPNTFALLEALSPIPFQQGNLSRFLEQTGMQGGHPTAQLMQLLNALLADNPQARTTGLTQFLAHVDPAAVHALLQGINLDQIQDADLHETIAGILQLDRHPGALRNALALENNLAAQGTSTDQLLGRLTGPTADPVAAMLDPNFRAALQHNLGHLGVLAEAQAADTPMRLQDGSFNPQRLLRNFLGTRAPGPHGDVAVNAGALYHFFDVIERNPFNRDNQAHTHDVLTGMLGGMTGGPTPAGFTPANISQFFANPANAAAFGNLLRSIHTERLPPQMREAIATLQQNWGNVDNGIVDVLDGADNVAWIMNHMRHPTSLGRLGLLPESVRVHIGSMLPSVTSYMTGIPYDVAENADHLTAVRNAFAAAGVSQDAAAQQPAPNAGGAAAQR